MTADESLHQKIQKLCECFVEKDPVREMSHMSEETDREDSALKWIALAILHGIEGNAKKISLVRTQDGEVKVNAKYRESEMTSPDPDLADKIFEIIRGITHIEGEEGEVELALGIGDSNIELEVELEQDEEGESITLEFA